MKRTEVGPEHVLRKNEKSAIKWSKLGEGNPRACFGIIRRKSDS